MGILLWRFSNIFYSLVGKLFNIRRCVIGVHHRIIRENNEIDGLSARKKKVAGFASKLTSCCRTVVNENPSIFEGTTAVPINQLVPKLYDNAIAATSSKFDKDEKMTEQESVANQGETFVQDVVEESRIKRWCWPSKVGVDDLTESSRSPPTTEECRQNQSQARDTENEGGEEISPFHPAHPEYEREVLNVYGKFLELSQKTNRILIMIITVTIISSVIIAGFEGCFLANVTVYDAGPCPYYGLMDCYYGSNHTYFQCTPDISISLPSFTSSATCFRWIGRDTSVSDVMTQVGACAGLLTALGAVVEVFIRFLFFVFQQRLGVTTGIRRILEKTVGINRVTQPCRCCGRKLWFHFGVLNLHLYAHPWLVVLVFMIYASLPLIFIAAIVLMTYFRISITSLTYIVLVTLVLICCLSLFWMLCMEDEIGRVIPGAWNDIKDAFDPMKKLLEKWTPVLESIIPKQDLERLHGLTDNLVKDARSHIDTLLKDITDHTENVFLQLSKNMENVLPKEEVKQFQRRSEDILSRAQNIPLHGSAQEIRARKEVEQSKDMRNILKSVEKI